MKSLSRYVDGLLPVVVAGRVDSRQGFIRSHRHYGYFFVFLAVVCFILSYGQVHSGRIGLGLLGLACGLPVGVFGWLVIAGTARMTRQAGGDSGRSGRSGAGKPVPVSPAPTHHLVAAKELPPSDKTHSLPKD